MTTVFTGSAATSAQNMSSTKDWRLTAGKKGNSRKDVQVKTENDRISNVQCQVNSAFYPPKGSNALRLGRAENNGSLPPGGWSYLRADCLYTGISSGPSTR